MKVNRRLVLEFKSLTTKNNDYGKNFKLIIMNIFFLDENPKLSAQYHVDKHVVKMVLETAQLLCGVHHMTKQVSNNRTLSSLRVIYKLSHKNHPCSVWARKSLSNYLYLCELGLELSKEYTYRYGKRHKSQDVIEWCITNRPNIPDIGFTEPAKAMPDEYKTESVTQSYRDYYLGEKYKLAKWKNRKIPHWFKLKEEVV